LAALGLFRLLANVLPEGFWRRVVFLGCHALRSQVFPRRRGTFVLLGGVIVRRTGPNVLLDSALPEGRALVVEALPERSVGSRLE